MTRIFRSGAAVLALLALIFTAYGCGGKAGHRFGQDGPAGATGPLTLPAPSGLPLKRSVLFTENGIKRMGSAFEATLPHNLLTGAAAAGNFAPNGGTMSSAAGLAYGIYSFGVENYNRDLNLRFTWATAPASGSCWVALSNYALNRWEWFPLPANNILDFSPLASYTGPAPDFNLYAAVLVTGSTPASLTEVRVGTQPAPGAPVADLQASPKSGPATLDVSFDAGGSLAFPPSTITKYEFDFGEGSGFEDNGNDFTVDHSYIFDGAYTARVRVTDSTSATAIATVAINVGAFAGYDEIEDNDDPFAPQALPALPVTDFRGNIGLGGAYDGDSEDIFSVSPAAGDTLTINVSFNQPAFVEVNLSDANLNFLAGGNVSNNVNTLSYTVQPGDALPLVVSVGEFSGQTSDYLLSAFVNAPQAVLTATPDRGAATLNVTLDASGSSDAPPGSIVSYQFDPEGDGTFLSAQVDPTLQFAYTTDGVYKPMVRVRDNDGNIGTDTASVLVGYDYDEQEDNDDDFTANALTVPVRDFLGSMGTGTGYPGYDGDTNDEYSFSVNPGDTFSVSVNYDDAVGDQMSMVIFDQSFTFFDFVDGSHGLISYTHHVVGVETQPFIISLFPTNGGFYGDYRLNVQLGAPNAQLSATPHSGPSPLNVTLDASASTDAPPGTIVSYEFDPEGTGTFLSPQAGATLAHLYQNDGIYYPRVRVTDDEGNISIARTSVLPGYDYDETEDNDFESEANQLTLPVAGFKGSLGTDAGYPGYDGDFDDYYQFSANIGDTVRATVTYDPANGNPDLEFHDDSFNINDGATGQDGKLVFSYNVNGTETQPFTLALHGFAFFGDYAMDVAVNPPTAELSATPNSGNPVLDVVLDASASSDFPPGTIATYEFDPEGDGTFLPPQAGPAMNFSYTTAGVFAPQVRVTDDEGYTDVAETLVLVGVTFNEIEPNDDQAQANQLPASLNFNNYAGSHSHGPGYHGYDGSKIDMFRFIAAPGSDVTLTAAYSNTTGELTLSMFDQFGNWVAEGGGVGGVATVDYILGSQPGDAGAPYFLQIWDPNDQHYGDYLLSGSRT